MKKAILFLFITINQLGFSQEFSVKMYFEDAIGNRDTLVIGYDINGSDTIDEIFGEVDIIETPLDYLFDVRISNYYWNESNGPSDNIYQTKKQILENNCGHYFSYNAIEIFCRNWPVKASWTKSSFNNDCLKESVFTSCWPGGWFDVCGPSDLYFVEMKNTDEVEFISNVDGADIGLGRINENGDTISCFFQAFGHNLIVGNKEILFEEIPFFPNPANEFLAFKVSMETVKSISIFDRIGKKQNIDGFENRIDISDLKRGLYIINIEFRDGNSQIYKFIKE